MYNILVKWHLIYFWPIRGHRRHIFVRRGVLHLHCRRAPAGEQRRAAVPVQAPCAGPADGSRQGKSLRRCQHGNIFSASTSMAAAFDYFLSSFFYIKSFYRHGSVAIASMSNLTPKTTFVPEETMRRRRE